MAILLSDSYKVINWDLSTKSLDTKYWGKVTDSGRGCKVALLQNGVLKTPSTETMRINFKKPSGLQIFLDGVISGNYFVFDFTEQVFAEQGEVMAELMLNVGGEWLMSSTFYIQVDQSFTSAIESSAELTALQTALSVVDEVENDIIALENPVYTEASTLANLVSGESVATLWGKVKKMFNSYFSSLYTESTSEQVVGIRNGSLLYKKWITPAGVISTDSWVIIGTYPIAQYPYLRIDHGQSTFVHATQSFLYSADSYPAQCGVRYNYVTGEIQAYSATLSMQPVICIYYTKA